MENETQEERGQNPETPPSQPKRRAKRRKKKTIQPLKELSQGYRDALEERQRDPSLNLSALAKKHKVRPNTLYQYYSKLLDGYLPKNELGVLCHPKRGCKFQYFDHEDLKVIELFVYVLDQADLSPSRAMLKERLLDLVKLRDGDDCALPSPSTLDRTINSLSSFKSLSARSTHGGRMQASREDLLLGFYDTLGIIRNTVALSPQTM